MHYKDYRTIKIINMIDILYSFLFLLIALTMAPVHIIITVTNIETAEVIGSTATKLPKFTDKNRIT